MESEHLGFGGSYLLNPKTGKVKLLQRTEPAQTSQPFQEDLSDEPSVEEAAAPSQN